MKIKKPILIKNGWIVTMNDQREVLRGDLLVVNGKLEKIAKKISLRGAAIVDAAERFVIPGMVQTHIHLCQTMFRGDADDLSLLDWLKKRIWPMEWAHSAASMRSSAELGLMEMQLSGTTAVLDMASVHHTNEVFSAAEESAIRYWGGKCLMDKRGSSGPLYEKTSDALKELEALIKFWHRKTDRLNVAVCPRFAVSCTKEMLVAAGAIAKQMNLVVHTHASESREEIAIVKKQTGVSNTAYLKSTGLLTPRSVIAHGVHLSVAETQMYAKAGASITHCPSSNLKLASGVAPIHNYLRAGINVSLGADGAPCNNRLDPFMEMRLAALLQKPFFGPTSTPALDAFSLATRNGARALGQLDNFGSLEVGKDADLVIVDRSHPSVATVLDPYSALVYSCDGRDVQDVMVGGKWVVRNKEHQVFDRARVIATARAEHRKLLARAF